MDQMWEIFSEQLEIVSERYEAMVIAFVLMSNHFHLLVRTPLANLDQIMNYLMRETSRHVGKRAGRINHVFGGRYKSTLIGDERYLYHAYRYVYQNPLAANLVSAAEDYPYSTLSTALGKGTLPFKLRDDLAIKWSPIPVALPKRVKWLNQKYNERERKLVGGALRRVVFSFTKQAAYKADVKKLTEFEF